MKRRYLLDTNIISEPIRPQPNPKVLARIQEYRREIATASVVWHELLFGCQRLPESRKRRMLEIYLHDVVEQTIPILPYAKAAAEWHAQERARLSLAGASPAFADGQIAAIANSHGLIVVTANVVDFANFKGLTIENWFD